ncbi:putative lipase MIL1 [Cladobotryum mycophilum]|uniref:Lipase MIL1 n=1 Tax=Cladobotryum mycophilum TaxID=491253 RepID=A0ABR0SEG7_9HYPO
MATDNQDAGPQAGSASNTTLSATAPTLAPLEFDDFGLPIKKYFAVDDDATEDEEDSATAEHATKDADDANVARDQLSETKKETMNNEAIDAKDAHGSGSDSDDGDFKDAQSIQGLDSRAASPVKPTSNVEATKLESPGSPDHDRAPAPVNGVQSSQPNSDDEKPETPVELTKNESKEEAPSNAAPHSIPTTIDAAVQPKTGHTRDMSTSSAVNGVSEFSHQQLSMQPEKTEEREEDGGWQEMPAYARFDMYDDNDRLIAKERNEEEEEKDEKYGYAGLGGAGKGYTRVIMDEDAQSATSMDDNTQYLFKNPNGTGMGEEDDDARDAVSQMQATKDLLTEGQRIAYVGVVRLEVVNIVKEAEVLEVSKKTKKEVSFCAESAKMWGQKMMMRVYTHMDINEAEQIMIEQLAEHGVRPEDLTPALLANSRVKNPMAEDRKRRSGAGTPRNDTPPPYPGEEKPAEMPPPYEVNNGEEMPEVKMPSQLPTTQKIDIDLRWTVLCDLFLLLVADSIYDSRSRVLMERVGKSLDISWIDICKFEKRVTDALEMQQQADKEDWNEDEHMEARRKAALKKRYLMMGLATVGGGLVIGLSAGLLAPVIGAGLAAGFTTIGVTGTGSFLAGAGGAAIITSTAAASGSFVGIRAANRRTGAVKTFEYRPLHNNKRVNLIVTVSGWMTGKVDDVRLPFSTVDPIMGDIYSVLWEPEMLKSMGDTINILATEALTQGLQQILGSTILVSLMAAVQLPVVLTKLAYLIDNPWAVSLDRATAAGKILADSLVERSLGTRPITLVGYSLGARVIFSCLKELAKKGAYGLVQNVYLFGSPVVVKKEEYVLARTVVSGRFVNGFNRNDWILGYLFRLTNGGIRRVAGLGPIEDLPWIENMDVTEFVAGHMEYRKAMPTLLMNCGWAVESEEFTEIEDPDPENHQDRQRELINEIEEARKELEKEGKSNRRSTFGLFGRRSKADKQEWEIYEDSAKKEAGGSTDDKNGSNHGVLFDIDAIRAELARDAQGEGVEEVQVKEIRSTMPPMKLDFSPVSSPKTPTRAASVDPRDSYRNSFGSTRSAETLPIRSSDYRTSREPTPLRETSRSALAYHYEPDHDGDEIQMTFDTSFGEPLHHKSMSVDDAASSRPGIRTSQTLPNVTIADPWGDGEDEEFGKEGEISMTFA